MFLNKQVQIKLILLLTTQSTKCQEGEVGSCYGSYGFLG